MSKCSSSLITMKRSGRCSSGIRRRLSRVHRVWVRADLAGDRRNQGNRPELVDSNREQIDPRLQKVFDAVCQAYFPRRPRRNREQTTQAGRRCVGHRLRRPPNSSVPNRANPATDERRTSGRRWGRRANWPPSWTARAATATRTIPCGRGTSGVAPVSWLMAQGVREGRRVVNFSEWAAYQPDRQRKLLADSCRGHVGRQDARALDAAAPRSEALNAGR